MTRTENSQEMPTGNLNECLRVCPKAYFSVKGTGYSPHINAHKEKFNINQRGEAAPKPSTATNHFRHADLLLLSSRWQKRLQTPHLFPTSLCLHRSATEAINR